MGSFNYRKSSVVVVLVGRWVSENVGSDSRYENLEIDAASSIGLGNVIRSAKLQRSGQPGPL